MNAAADSGDIVSNAVPLEPVAQNFSLKDHVYAKLRQAILDADSGDTIEFGVTGTITLTSGQLEVMSKDLTIANSNSSD